MVVGDNDYDNGGEEIGVDDDELAVDFNARWLDINACTAHCCGAKQFLIGFSAKYIISQY